MSIDDVANANMIRQSSRDKFTEVVPYPEFEY
jgi:hypothetical protein